jgi:tRNA A37 threonylcarbamoyladenosine dehydratase
VGKFKADALRDRINQINPDAEIDIIYDFIRKENVNKYINKTSTYSVSLYFTN